MRRFSETGHKDLIALVKIRITRINPNRIVKAMALNSQNAQQNQIEAPKGLKNSQRSSQRVEDNLSGRGQAEVENRTEVICWGYGTLGGDCNFEIGLS